jgi:hypothetical protein
MEPISSAPEAQIWVSPPPPPAHHYAMGIGYVPESILGDKQSFSLNTFLAVLIPQYESRRRIFFWVNQYAINF